MRRDPKAFRERFKAWKNGQLVYLSGRPTDLFLDTMEGVARLNADNWGVSEDEALLHALNDNTYNYNGYYDKYPESSADSRSHWTDEFKTVYHPTFSNESRYHGKKSLYNPLGLRGGMWVGDKFQPAPWLSKAKAWRINKLGYKGGKDGQERIDTPNEIAWMRNWLLSRKDILEQNAKATTWAYDKYQPKNKDADDVRESGFNVQRYANVLNPFAYFKNSTPTRNRVNKLIYSQIENAENTPKVKVGPGTSVDYNLRGVYVEPNYFNNGGNYIAFAGDPDPDVVIHELTHSSHPKQQENYIRNIIFNGNVPKVTPKNKYGVNDNVTNAKEIYGALLEFRFKNNLDPKQKIDLKWINDNRDLFENNYLKNISDEDKVRLFNEVAYNKTQSNNNLLYAKHGKDDHEEDRFATTDMPELVVTAPRKYIQEYDKNGNPVYTTDRTKSMGYESSRPSESKYQKWANRDKNAKKYTDDIIKAAQIGIGGSMLAAASPVGEPVVDMFADLYKHPIANILGMANGAVGEKYDQKYGLTKSVTNGKVDYPIIGSLLGYMPGRMFADAAASKYGKFGKAVILPNSKTVGVNNASFGDAKNMSLNTKNHSVEIKQEDNWYTRAIDILLNKYPKLLQKNQTRDFVSSEEFRNLDKDLQLALLVDRVPSKYNTDVYVIKPQYKQMFDEIETRHGLRVAMNSNETNPSSYYYQYFHPDIYNKSLITDDATKIPIVLGELSEGIDPNATYKTFKNNWRGFEDYKDKIKLILHTDWDNDGPLKSHLLRSGIDNPDVLLNYMVSPKIAFEESILRPGLFNREERLLRDMLINKFMSFDPNRYLQKYKLSAMDTLAERFPEKIEKIVEELNNDFENIWDVKGKISELADFFGKELASKRGEIFTKPFDYDDDLFADSFKKLLSSIDDKTLRRQLYDPFEQYYENAFASRSKGFIFVPINNKSKVSLNLPETISHELGHLEDLINSSRSNQVWNIVKESTQNAIEPTSKSPLFSLAFNLDLVSPRIKNYFGDSFIDGATEMAQRATQLKDFYRLKPGEKLTVGLLISAKNIYPKVVMDNNMNDFFKTIVNYDLALDWINAHGKSIAPLLPAGAATTATLSRVNNQKEPFYKNGKDAGIHIKPSHRGKLTALKKRTGKSEAELYKTGGPDVRKMITFARSSRKWHKNN